MTRQDALKTIWFRLFIIFISLTTVCIGTALYAKYLNWDFRCSMLVFVSGNVGSYVGIHRSLGELNDSEIIDLSGSWLGLVVPSFVGGILAFVLYLMFLGNIVNGVLFPKFEADRDYFGTGFEALFNQHAAEGLAGYGKLFFWSFVAGLNQKYVVDVVNSVRSKP
jgi:hypothetical protein